MGDWTPEQEARDMLERMSVEGAQSFSAGEIVELANCIAERKEMAELLKRAEPMLVEYGLMMSQGEMSTPGTWLVATRAVLAKINGESDRRPSTFGETLDMKP